MSYKILINIILIFLAFPTCGQNSLKIPDRNDGAESGSAFMNRITALSLEEREAEIFKALSEGNMPDYLRNVVEINYRAEDSLGQMREVTCWVMPDYLAVGSDDDFCRIPMNPYTAQRLADRFEGSLITSILSDKIYEAAVQKPSPFFYKPIERENESVNKFMVHNSQIQTQLQALGASAGELVAGIKKDVILSTILDTTQNKVVIYGWHKPDGKPIQPVYGKHVDWYVDYSHGIRLMHEKVMIDNVVYKIDSVLKDPLLFKLFSNESKPMKKARYGS